MIYVPQGIIVQRGHLLHFAVLLEQIRVPLASKILLSANLVWAGIIVLELRL